MKNYHPYHRDLKGTDTIIATIRALFDACMPAIITIVGLYILVKTLFRK